MSTIAIIKSCRYAVVSLCLLALCACGILRPSTTPLPTLYTLDDKASVIHPPPSAGAPTAPTLIISPPQAAAGFDSPRILYLREAQNIEYFAYSEWVDSPPRMLAPLLVASLEHSSAFRAVMLTPSAAVGDLRLDTEIVRLQQEFHTQPSRTRFTLRAYLVDNMTRQVLASREFDQSVVAESEDARGGVAAARRAVQATLEQLANFCSEAASRWRPAPTKSMPD
jgi:cholesterol transport system auxiliary component